MSRKHWVLNKNIERKNTIIYFICKWVSVSVCSLTYPALLGERVDGASPPFWLVNIDFFLPFSLTPVHLPPTQKKHTHMQSHNMYLHYYQQNKFPILCICFVFFYLTEASSSSGTSTLRLQATRSPSVAIWLRGALLCICRTPSICPLRRRPTLGGECTSVGDPTDPEGKDIKEREVNSVTCFWFHWHAFILNEGRDHWHQTLVFVVHHLATCKWNWVLKLTRHCVSSNYLISKISC